MTTVRRATAADAAAISRLHVSSWREAYTGLLPDDLLANQSFERRLQYWAKVLDPLEVSPSVFWVVADGETVLGFASAGPSRDADRVGEDFWEVFAIYLSADHWGLGLGSALFRQALLSAAQEAVAASLWVLDGNERAIRFYERHGFSHDGTVRVETLGGQQVRELRYTRQLPLDSESVERTR